MYVRRSFYRQDNYLNVRPMYFPKDGVANGDPHDSGRSFSIETTQKSLMFPAYVSWKFLVKRVQE